MINSSLKYIYIAITCKNFNSIYRVEISAQFGKPEMKFQPEMKIPNFPYNQHFHNLGWKSDTKHAWIPWYFFKKMATWQERFKWIDDKPIILIECLQELDSSYVKISFLNADSFQWLQGFEVIIMIYITLISTITKHLELQISIFCCSHLFICFWHASGLAFLLSLNFLFTQDYIFQPMKFFI